MYKYSLKAIKNTGTLCCKNIIYFICPGFCNLR